MSESIRAGVTHATHDPRRPRGTACPLRHGSTRPLLALLLVLAGLGWLAHPQASVALDSARPVLAYYYGWWTPDNWTGTVDLPTERYDSASDEVMRSQIRQARDAGITGFICTFQYNCARLTELAGQEGGFSVAISIDPGADGSLSSFDAIVSAMKDVAALTANPGYLRWNGRPLVVFWDSGILPGDSSVAAFQRLRDTVDPGRGQFWLGGGTDFSYLDVFDALHFFDISWESSQGAAMASYAGRLGAYNAAHAAGKPFVATVMPGYDDSAYRDGHRRDRENGAYYRANWDTALAHDAQAVVITSWNEWHEGSQIEPSVSYGDLYLDITRQETARYRNQPAGFADESFFRTWRRTDQPVGDGHAGRSWVWGAVRTEGVLEPYGAGSRRVQYFDKSRMEISNPEGDRNSPWYVTNGLLVREMIEGRLQLGDNTFETRARSDEALAGDPRALNPTAPGYAALSSLLGRAPDRQGSNVTEELRRDGSTAVIDPPADAQLAVFVDETGHNIPRVFWDFMNQSGPVWDGSHYVNERVVDWLYAFGYPISEPYWVRANVAGAEQWVLVQAFERRVLTCTPTNPPAYQVEMGNVGQHYHRWRYGWAW